MTDSNVKTAKGLRFSVIDFVIVLMILACFVGVVLRYDLVNKLFSKTVLTEARITFVAEAVTPEERAVFTESTVFYTDRDVFGILSSLEAAPAIVYYENSIGSLVHYEHATLLDLNGVFRAQVVSSENGYLLNGNTFIAPGSTFTVMAGGASVRITVLRVNLAEE